MKKQNKWISKLNLQAHPEGGYFSEVYRSDVIVGIEGLPEKFPGDRNILTSIYFLLERGQRSVFHRIKSDETWYFHDGSPLNIFIIDHQGEILQQELGISMDSRPQITVPADCWFAAESTGDFTLVSCAVSPGFDFQDFEMADEQKLLLEFPKHKEVIEKFTS